MYVRDLLTTYFGSREQSSGNTYIGSGKYKPVRESEGDRERREMRCRYEQQSIVK